MLIFLLLFLFINAASSDDCECSKTEQNAATWGYIYILNPTDVGGDACVKNCTITAYSGSDDKGLSSFLIKAFEPTGNAEVKVIDSNNQLMFSAKRVSTDQDKPYSVISATARVTIEILIYDNKPVSIFGTMAPANTLYTTIPTVVTSPPPTTPKYTGNLTHDPLLISHDIMFMVDESKGQGKAQFNAMQNIATQLVDRLSITNSVNDTSHTRLALRALGPYGGGVLGADWTLSKEDFQTGVSGILWFSTGGQANFADVASNALKNAFNVEGDTRTRKNAQRTMVILTSSSPSDLKDFKGLSTSFIDADVKLLIIGYNINGTDYTDGSSSWINFYTAYDDSSSTVDTILEKYFVTATNLCRTDISPPINLSEDKKSQTVKVPSNYQGPDGTTTTWPSLYQTGRYCNFQQNTYIFESTQNICFTIYYDLEVERDYLRVFEGQGNQRREIVSLSGYDVTGTTFTTKSPASIQFVSDSKQVYGGFYVNATLC